MTGPTGLTAPGLPAVLTHVTPHKLPGHLKLTRPTRPGRSFFKLLGYNPFPMQQRIHNSKALYRVANLGRQVGKSEAAAVEAAFELCANPGSKGWIVAPTFEQAEVIFSRTLEKVEKAALSLPNIKVKYRKGASLEIVVEHYDRPHADKGAVRLDKSTFRGKSGQKPDNLRGATLTYLIIDETAMMPEQVWSEALEAMLSTTQGWVLFTSTPKGFNWFHRIFGQGQSTDPEDAAWESFTAPSWDANPTVPRSWYENKKLRTPDLEFRQEYGAEFVSESGSVFQGVDRCPKLEIDPMIEHGVGLLSKQLARAHTYVIGADFGRLQDYSVFTVMDLDTREMVASYRYSDVDWERQLENLKIISDYWHNALVVGDNNGVGDVLQQQCNKLDIPFEGLKFTGSMIKAETINHLAIGLEHGYLSIQNDPGLLQELRLYRYTKTESGQLKMQAEGRNHDDRVVSLALAYSKFEHYGLLPENQENHDGESDVDDATLRLFEKIGSIESVQAFNEGSQFELINSSLISY